MAKEASFYNGEHTCPSCLASQDLNRTTLHKPLVATFCSFTLYAGPFGQWYGRWRLEESSQCITASFFLLEQPDSRVHLLRYTEQSFVFGANFEGKKGL